MTELLAFYVVEPFGEWRADLRMGIATRELWKINLRRGARAPTAADFMPFVEHERKPEGPKSVAQRIKGFFKGLKRGDRR